VILLDAYALIALLGGERAAAEVSRLLEAGDNVVSSANLAEAADRLARVHGIDVERTRSAIELIEQSTNLRVRPVERRHAWCAAALRAKHYHRTRRPLSLGDCLLLATAEPEDTLASSDPHVLGVAAEEGIAWIALRDSSGRRRPPG
jgi:uncharacterized protein with PIN domain